MWPDDDDESQPMTTYLSKSLVAKVQRHVRSLVLALSVLPLALFAQGAEETRPNVIFIMSDDQGTVDVGCYGSNDLVTPHLDALAGRGVRFTQFYAVAPVCSPSRAALLTGRYPARVGLTENAASQPGGKAGLAPTELTMAEVFKTAGYATAHFGKWHLGYTPETMPNAQGFDYSFGHMGGCIDNYSHFYYWSGPNVHDLHRNGVEVFHDGEFFPELMVREACAFMERHRNRRFFIYYAMNTPHYPYQGEAKWLKRFKALPYPRNLYAAFLASQDERIGRLVAKVDALGLRGRTIIVFQSDNGHSTEERAHFGGGSAGRFRGAKFSLFEGGIRVPAIITWPAKLPQGVVRNQPAHGTDWLPTLAELCGVPLPPVKLDGRSLLPILKLRDDAVPPRILHWQTGQGTNAQWAVRDGHWKLIGNAWDTSSGVVWGRQVDTSKQKFPLFLANLSNDPAEQKNVADQYPDVVARLRELHEEHMKDR
jgi:arylsulfatase A-like enzyme